MKQLAPRLTICAFLSIAVLGTALSSNSRISRAEDPHRDPACMNICFLEFQECFFAAQPDRSATNKCNADYKHCTAHCK